MALLADFLLAGPAIWALATLFVFIVGEYIWGYWRLRHIPGPWIAGFSDLWLMRKTWRGETFKELAKVCGQYGPVFRIAPNFVAVGDPAEVRKLWGVRSKFDRSTWYKGFRLDPPHDTSITMCDGDDHAAYRAKLAPGYGGRDVAGIHEAVDEGILRLARLIDEKYISTETDYRPCDLARKVQYTMLDIVGQIAFGESLGFLDADADKWDYIKQTEESLPVMQMIAMRPWVIKLLQSRYLRKFVMPSAKDPVGLGRMIGIARSFVAKRFGPNKVEADDMLGSFIKHGLDQRTAEAESILQVISGSDTTACAVRSALAHIITSPLLYTSLLSEATSFLTTTPLPASSIITNAQAQSLPLLQATLKEALRIWPPIHGVMPRVSKFDATICGVRIPAGTNVCWSSCAVLRNREVFGEDAEVFRAERWLTADKERLAGMDNIFDLTFGWGRWGCLGRGIAMVEMGKVVFEILRRWQFTVVDTEKPILNQWAGMMIQSGLWVRIEKTEWYKEAQSAEGKQ